MDLSRVFKSIVAGMGVVANYLFGGWDQMLMALVAFVVLDWVTGVLAAYTQKTLNSDIGFRGIAKKVLFFVLVAVANIIDQTGGFSEPILRTAVIWFLVANEGLSILENLARAGVPVPDVLRGALDKLNRRDQE